MSIEFIGYISNNNSSETIVRSGPVVDRHHIETVAKAHENAGFDRVLLAFHSTSPDGLQIGQHVLSVTEDLKVLIAQRPGLASAYTNLAEALNELGDLAEALVQASRATVLNPQDGRAYAAAFSGFYTPFMLVLIGSPAAPVPVRWPRRAP